MNLLDNSVKYTFAGKISINAYKLNERVIEISIKDTGMGIEKDKLHILQ